MNADDALTIMHDLERFGWKRVTIRSQPPGETHEDRRLDRDSAHVVVAGAVTVTTAEGTHTYGEGDRFDIAEDEPHSTRAGAEGVTMVVGEM